MVSCIHVKQGGSSAAKNTAQGSGDVEVWDGAQHQFTLSDIPEDPIRRVLWLSELVRKSYELGKKMEGRKAKVSEHD